MCCLFGLIDCANMFSAKEKNHIIKVLATECEARGIDAAGIAFNTASGLHIFKRPVPAHKLWYRIPDNASVVMGHTRMTTQGSEKYNFNNHPFYGKAGMTSFALAHNGVLHNDDMLKRSEKLPPTHIQTDSYVAVQLIEKENALGFESIRKMAEKTEGSFCYTVLDDKDDLYIVKGDNPMAIYKFNGFYLYASTDEILTRAITKLHFKNYSKVNISCGDILKIAPNGMIEVQRFNFPDFYSSYGSYGCFYEPAYDETMLETLTEYAGYFGIDPEEVMMLYEPAEMRRCIEEIKMLEMC